MKRFIASILSTAMLLSATMPAFAEEGTVEEEIVEISEPVEDPECHWEYAFDGDYWIEHGKRQGVYGDPLNVWDTIYGIERGREIYDPESDAWYWLDACWGGRKAAGKEVWFPYVFQGERPGSTQGKWCLYDDEGAMVKYIVVSVEPDYGKDYMPIQGTYKRRIRFYHQITGALLKGTVRLSDFYRLSGEDADGDGEDDGIVHVEFVTDQVRGRADLDCELINQLRALTTGEWPVYDFDNHQHYTLSEWLVMIDEPKER